MRISRISAWRVELPLHEGSYKWSGGKSVTVFDSTIVGIETDAGLVGYGECCPLGPFYLPAYAEGVRAGLRGAGPASDRRGPAAIAKLNQRMDAALKGHPYVKSGIDIACWDILGQGDRASRFACCWAAATATTCGSTAPFRRSPRKRWPAESPAIARKVIAAFNSRSAATRTSTSHASAPCRPMLQTGRPAGRRRQHRLAACTRPCALCAAVRDVDVYIEQPCLTYEECLAVRRHTDHPFVLDENVDGLDMLLRGKADLAMDVVNIKISKFGGLTQSPAGPRSVRLAGNRHDHRRQLGRGHHHGRHRPPGRRARRPSSCSHHRLQQLCDRQHRRRRAAARNGRMAASTAPGLGIKPRMELLGKPVLSIP